MLPRACGCLRLPRMLDPRGHMVRNSPRNTSNAMFLGARGPKNGISKYYNVGRHLGE